MGAMGGNETKARYVGVDDAVRAHKGGCEAVRFSPSATRKAGLSKASNEQLDRRKTCRNPMPDVVGLPCLEDPIGHQGQTERQGVS